MAKSKKKQTVPVYVNGEHFTITGLRRKMQLEGLDPRDYQKHPDYLLYLNELRLRRAAKINERKNMKERGELDKDAPLTNHPNSPNQHLVDKDMDKKLKHKLKKSILETLDTMETLKKIAKSKLDPTIREKLKKKKALDPSEIANITLADLKDITSIIQNASKAQLEAGKSYLSPEQQKAVKKSIKQDVNSKRLENKDFDFENIQKEVENLENVDFSSKNDLLRNMDKIFN